MKSIPLTNKQKEKLLEMCKALFPELDICLTGQSGRNWDSVNECFINIWNIKEGETNIHWFEFCMIYLVSKIQNCLPEELVWREQPPYVKNIFDWKKGNKWTMYTEFFFLYPKNIYKRHPIDYLYSEFLKIKQ
jgi:hypothetical protein